MSERKPSPCIEPALLRERDAGAFLGVSAAFLRDRRIADLRAIAEGREPSGPPWVTLGAMVFYRPAALRAWIDATTVTRGRVGFSKTRQTR